MQEPNGYGAWLLSADDDDGTSKLTTRATTMTTSATTTTMMTMVMTIMVRAVFFIRKHVEMSSGLYPGAKIIVWAITWRENREGDDVENREGDDVGPEAQSCTTPATHQRCTQRQTRFGVSYSREVRRRHSCPFRSQSSKVRGVASSDFRASSASGSTL